MDNVLKNFWELESLGILPAEPSVYDTFKQSIKFDDGRYEVRMSLMALRGDTASQ